MVMALGVGAWTAALFHLFTHAFFKAGLFLGSGSVAHAVHSFDMKKDMGGMRKYMPKTYWTFMICTGALIGLLPLAGFWSKDEILAGAPQLGGHSGYEIFMVIGIIGAFMTAAYMTRCVYLTFFGEPRGAAADPHHQPHESGPRIVVPLYILSALAVVAGFANLPFGIFGDGIEACASSTTSSPWATYFPPRRRAASSAWRSRIVSTLVGLHRASASRTRTGAAARSTAPPSATVLARAGYMVLENKYYFDSLYTDVIVGGIKGPIARAVVLVQPERHRRHRERRRRRAARARPASSRQRIDQQVVDGARQRLGHRRRGQRARSCASCRPARCSSTARCSSAAPSILAGIFVFAHLARERQDDGP